MTSIEDRYKSIVDERDKPRTQPQSLQALSLEQCLENLLESDSSRHEFFSLHSRGQELFLGKLRAEIIRLRKIEKDWDALRHRCPRSDFRVSVASRLSEGEYDNTADQQEVIKSKWSYFDDESEEARNGLWRNLTMRWDSRHLCCRRGDPDRELVLTPARHSHEYVELNKSLEYDEEENFKTQFSGIEDKISSQLLLYRLTVVFGMPPSRDTDKYKSCWTVSLRRSDGSCFMNLSDYKGGISFHLNSVPEKGEQSHKDALELLNHIAGARCPHTYDGIVAGAIA